MQAIYILIVFALILLLGAFGEFFFRKTGVPDALWLIIFGFFVTSILKLITPVSFMSMLPVFVAITLIIILFEGGLHLRFLGLVKYSLQGLALGFWLFIFSMLFVFITTYLLYTLGILQEWSVFGALMLGSIVGGTSSVVVIPLVQIAKLGDDITNIMSIESAITDALSVVVTSTLAVYVLETEAKNSVKLILSNLASSFAVAIVIGFILAFIWLYLLKKMEATKDMKNYFYFITLALLIFLYVFIGYIGGSEVVAIFIFALVLGNSKEIKNLLKTERFYVIDKSLTFINSQLAFLIKSFFFVLIGMLLSLNWKIWIIALIISLVLIIPRILSVFSLSYTRKLESRKKRLIYFFAPKGLAAGVMAISVSFNASLLEKVPMLKLFVPLVFSIVAISILISTISLAVYKYKSKAPEDSP